MNIPKQVQNTWQRLHRLVGEIEDVSLGRLNTGAMTKNIVSVEQRLSVTLPEDFKASLLCHNGCKPGQSCLVFEWYSVDEIMKATLEKRDSEREDQEAYDAEPTGLTEGGWSHTSLMVADSGVGWQFVIDCANEVPYIYQPAGYALPLGKSFADYLDGLAANISAGFYELVQGCVWMPEWGERLASRN